MDDSKQAQLVVVNIHSEAQRPGADRLVADVGRLRKDASLFHDILGSRGTRIPVAAVVANLADPGDHGTRKALARVRRAAGAISSSVRTSAAHIRGRPEPGMGAVQRVA